MQQYDSSYLMSQVYGDVLVTKIGLNWVFGCIIQSVIGIFAWAYCIAKRADDDTKGEMTVR